VRAEGALSAALEAPALKQAAAEFESAPVLSVGAQDKALCVLQGESGTVPFDHMITLGSQDATTCVIAFVATVYGVSCLHIDEDTCCTDYLERRFAHGALVELCYTCALTQSPWQSPCAARPHPALCPQLTRRRRGR